MQYVQENPGRYSNISTNTTTQVKTGAGVLKSIVINATAAGTITIYDEIGSGTTTKIATLKASVVEGTYAYNVRFNSGLKIVTAGASDISVSYE